MVIHTGSHLRSYIFFPDLKHSLRRASVRGPAWYSSPPMMDETLSSSSTITANSLSLLPSMLRSLMLADPGTQVECTCSYNLPFPRRPSFQTSIYSWSDCQSLKKNIYWMYSSGWVLLFRVSPIQFFVTCIFIVQKWMWNEMLLAYTLYNMKLIEESELQTELWTVTLDYMHASHRKAM